MKRRHLTPEEKLWRHVWRVWPDAMRYELGETPFDAPGRASSLYGVRRSRSWLQSKHQQTNPLQP